MKVQEIMTREVVTIGPEADIRDVARILVDAGISGLPVCGAQRELLGVISEGDIVMKEGGAPPAGRWHILGRTPAASPKLTAVKVREAMTAPVVTIPPYASVAEAARTMYEHGISRLPVVLDGALVGIVSRTDLVRAFVRTDEDIRREIREDVLRGALCLAVPDAIHVEVERGAVRLSGRLESELDADLVPRLVSRIPGVVSVESELAARNGRTASVR
jgi:CBS domain-containing protein